jgi:exodeoxyribonuclease VIII
MDGIRISNKEYRNRDGVSSTDLKKMTKSPAHFRYWKDNPQEDTHDLLFGRAVHKYVLEKDDFFTEFAVAPNVDRRTKAGKEQFALFEVENEGKDIITQDDFDKIKAMYDALYATPFVERLLSGEKELSFFMEDEKTGLTVKCRPDCLSEIGDTNILIDYKSTKDASSDAFMKDAIKLNYDLQMAMYKEIAEKNLGKKYAVIFIAQEKTAPYLVNILEANEYFLKSGADMYHTYLDIYSECNETGNWYGYTYNAETGNNGINTLGLPNWLQKQYEV